MTEWISVKDKLPEEDEMMILFYSTEGGVCSGNYEVEEEVYYSLDYIGGAGYRKSVTHWMPLPEPPKEES